MRVVTAPRLLSDEQIREAHRKYEQTSRGLRSVAREYGISHVQLAAGFVRLGLARRGNRTTDPAVIDRVIWLRQARSQWRDIAADVNLSVRQVQNIYTTHYLIPLEKEQAHG